MCVKGTFLQIQSQLLLFWFGPLIVDHVAQIPTLIVMFHHLNFHDIMQYFITSMLKARLYGCNGNSKNLCTYIGIEEGLDLLKNHLDVKNVCLRSY